MTEEAVKRVSFKTITSGFGSAASMDLKSAGEKAPAKKKSFRITLDLFEPDAESFPEFNFRQLLILEKKKHKRKEKKANGVSGGGGAEHLDDPLGGDDDDDVARLAKEMEEKYGSGSAYSKGIHKRGAVEHQNKAIGYDENDSFIDNTDAYDELIPDEIEPNFGGFYINSGLLEFQNTPNFERPEDAQRMPKARKRTLSTSSEDEEEERKGADQGESKAAAEDTAAQHPKKKKKKKLKEGKNPVNGEIHHHVDKKTASSSSSKEKGTKVKPNKATTPKEDPSGAPIKTTTVKDMLRLKRDNHRNKADNEQSSGSSSSSGSDASEDDDDEEGNDDNNAEVDIDQTDEERDSEAMDTDQRKTKLSNGGVIDASPQLPSTQPTLPSDVSKDLMANMIILEQSARLLNGPGENVLTNAASLDILLAIEQETQLPSKPANFRPQVYAYLADKIKCRREDLLMKAEQMRGHAQEAKARKLLQKLKKVVEGRMVKLLETYEAESRRVTEMKSTMHVIGFVSESQVQMPRRKFHWTDSSRKLLYEVYEGARVSYAAAEQTNKQQQQQKKRARTVEEHLAEFLKQDVLPLWPTGWMKYEELAKEVERRRVAVQKQNFIKDLVNSSAFGDVGAMPGESVPPGAGETEKEMAGEVNGGAVKMANGGEKVVLPPVAAASDQSRSSNLGKQKQQSNHQQQPKKSSFDYSITNLIGNSAAAGESATAATTTTGSSLKVRSVSTLNNSPSTAAIPTATVIVSCDDEDDEEEVAAATELERNRTKGTAKLSSPHITQPAISGGGGSAGVVRAKRASDSDSSCEIVHVYSSEGKQQQQPGQQGHSNRKNGGGIEDSLGGCGAARTGSVNHTAARGSTGSQVTPMDTNDIDVNQIMQDLKDWQQWESSGNFSSAKKTEFAESKRELLMMQKAKYMDHLSTLAATITQHGHHQQQQQHHKPTQHPNPNHQGQNNGFK